MSLASNVLSVGLSLYAAYCFFSSVLGKVKVAAYKQVCLYIFFFTINIVVVVMFGCWDIRSQIFWVLTVFLLTLVYQGRLRRRLGATCFLATIYAMCTLVSGLFLALKTHADFAALMSEDQIFYLFGVLMTNVSALFIIKFIEIIKMTAYGKIPLTLLLGLCLMATACLLRLWIAMTFAAELQLVATTASVIAISVLLISSNLVLIHFCEAHIKNEQQRIEYTLIEKRIDVQTEYYKKLVEEHKTISGVTHDIKNNLLAIGGSIVGGDYSGATRRINEICVNLSDVTKIYTSNLVIDAVLNAKLRDALNVKVDMQILTSSFSDIKIDAIDIGVILGNALDNAIHACAQISTDMEKKIYVKLLYLDDYISIVIENTVDKPVPIIDGMVVTASRGFRGYGIKNIRALADKYDGDIQFRNEENKCTVNILLKSSCAR